MPPSEQQATKPYDCGRHGGLSNERGARCPVCSEQQAQELTVRAVKAFEVEQGAEVIIAEFRGVVDESREGPGCWWLSLEGGEGADLARDSTVYVLAPRVVERPTGTKCVCGHADFFHSPGGRTIPCEECDCSDYSYDADATRRAESVVERPDEGNARTQIEELIGYRTFGLRCAELGPGLHDFVAVTDLRPALMERIAEIHGSPVASHVSEDKPAPSLGEKQ